MDNFKKSVSISGKYAKLEFIDGELFSIDKEGNTEEVDLMEDLFSVYKDQIFSLNTKASYDEEIEVED